MATALEHGDQTRARLLRAAGELIAERGWGSVTTRLVAERAGVRPGLVHYHFSSVTDLLIEAALRVVRAETGRMTAAVTALPGEQGLTLLLEAAGSYTPEDTTTLVFTETMLAATRHERLRGELAGVLRECREILARWLRDQGAADDASASAAVLLAAFDGLVLHRIIDEQARVLPVGGPLRRIAALPADPSPTSPNPSPAGQTSTSESRPGQDEKGIFR